MRKEAGSPEKAPGLSPPVLQCLSLEPVHITRPALCSDSPCQVHTWSRPGEGPSWSCKSRGCQGGYTTAACRGRRSGTGREYQQLARLPPTAGTLQGPHPVPQGPPGQGGVRHSSAAQDRPVWCPELPVILRLGQPPECSGCFMSLRQWGIPNPRLWPLHLYWSLDRQLGASVPGRKASWASLWPGYEWQGGAVTAGPQGHL